MERFPSSAGLLASVSEPVDEVFFMRSNDLVDYIFADKLSQHQKNYLWNVWDLAPKLNYRNALMRNQSGAVAVGGRSRSRSRYLTQEMVAEERETAVAVDEKETSSSSASASASAQKSEIIQDNSTVAQEREGTTTSVADQQLPESSQETELAVLQGNETDHPADGEAIQDQERETDHPANEEGQNQEAEERENDQEAAVEGENEEENVPPSLMNETHFPVLKKHPNTTKKQRRGEF